MRNRLLLILDRAKTRIRFNHDWLLDLKLADLNQAWLGFHRATVHPARELPAALGQERSQFILHETFYALMQGYDAVAMNTDVQIGGTDQLQHHLRRAQAARTVWSAPADRHHHGILPARWRHPDVKSLGNHIPILADPDDMYGKYEPARHRHADLFQAGHPLHAVPGQDSPGSLDYRRASPPRSVKMELAA